MYTAQEIRQYCHMVVMLGDAETLACFQTQHPKLADELQVFTKLSILVMAVEAVARARKATYAELVKYFSTSLFRDLLPLDEVERTIQEYLPLALEQKLVAGVISDEGIKTFEMTDAGRSLLSIKKEVSRQAQTYNTSVFH